MGGQRGKRALWVGLFVESNRAPRVVLDLPDAAHCQKRVRAGFGGGKNATAEEAHFHYECCTDSGRGFVHDLDPVLQPRTCRATTYEASSRECVITGVRRGGR
jgi:hypothetical protein